MSISICKLTNVDVGIEYNLKKQIEKLDINNYLFSGIFFILLILSIIILIYIIILLYQSIKLHRDSKERINKNTASLNDNELYDMTDMNINRTVYYSKEKKDFLNEAKMSDKTFFRQYD